MPCSLQRRAARGDFDKRIGPRVQGVDGPAQIQALSGPVGMRRVRTELKPLRRVTGPELGDGVTVTARRLRHLGERSAVWPLEPERPVGLARRLIALLVHRAVMATAEKG